MSGAEYLAQQIERVLGRGPRENRETSRDELHRAAGLTCLLARNLEGEIRKLVERPVEADLQLEASQPDVESSDLGREVATNRAGFTREPVDEIPSFADLNASLRDVQRRSIDMLSNSPDVGLIHDASPSGSGAAPYTPRDTPTVGEGLAAGAGFRPRPSGPSDTLESGSSATTERGSWDLRNDEVDRSLSAEDRLAFVELDDVGTALDSEQREQVARMLGRYDRWRTARGGHS